MTPQERQLIDGLFDRLARLETAPRDADAERAIAEGLSRAPNAVYALVQTALVQGEALRRADARIRELSGDSGSSAASGGFLDSMRQALGSRSGGTSVPSVHANTPSGPDPRWNSGGAMASSAPSPGGSFLGTAAASAAGVIGGALLLNSISSMFGHHGASAFAAMPPANSPWDNSASGSDMARDAGVNDIGNNAQPSQLLDDNGADTTDFSGDDGGGFDDGDFGGGDFGSGDSV